MQAVDPEEDVVPMYLCWSASAEFKRVDNVGLVCLQSVQR